MRRAVAAGSLLCALLAPLASASAQQGNDPAAAVGTDGFPAVVKVGQSALGEIFTSASGMTVYAMDARIARSRSGAGTDYCVGPCAKVWTPVPAAADAKPIGRWSVVKGAQGPQWAFKGNPIFTFQADRAPGSTAGNAYDDLWSVIPYVPPVPRISAPDSVKPLFVGRAYILADASGRALFAAPDGGKCAGACESWSPLLAGMASRDVGDWKVVRDADRAHWSYRGRPVYVADEQAPTAIPAGAVMLKP